VRVHASLKSDFESISVLKTNSSEFVSARKGQFLIIIPIFTEFAPYVVTEPAKVMFVASSRNWNIFTESNILFYFILFYFISFYFISFLFLFLFFF
jgi:hypothetical protein